MRRRTLVVALLVAAALGFAAGWLTGRAGEEDLRTRVEEARDRIRYRMDELTH